MLDTEPLSKDRFRKGFVLIMTIACSIMFFAMIWGFVEALLMAMVFSGTLYPFYLKLNKVFKGRSTTASLFTLLIALLVIVIPLLFLLGMIAEQAAAITSKVEPWLEQQVTESVNNEGALPDWVPYKEKLDPYKDQISEKLGEFAESTASFLGSSLAHATGGTLVFFLDLFVMLYAMFFFLIHGPNLINIIMDYFPLSREDKDKVFKVGLSVSRATIKGTLIIGMIQGALGGIGFAVAGIGSAVFWGALMAILSVLPGIGTAIVWVPGVIYLFATGEMVTATLLTAWCAGVVGTIDNFLRPVLVGRDTEMPELLILLATLGGLGFFGAAGLVLGPVLAALFMTILAIYSRVFADYLEE